jgi:Ala-tRNA(Pro) deacylase
MPLGKKLERFLHTQRAEHARSVHPGAETARAVANEEAISPHRVAKTLVFHGDKGFGMAVLPANLRADLDELKSVLGLRDIRLASQAELRSLFPDCELGAMPPFGNLYGMPAVADANLATRR